MRLRMNKTFSDLSKPLISIVFTFIVLSSVATEELMLPEVTQSGNWHFGGWHISGNTGVSAARLKSMPDLQPRPFWAPWRSQPRLELAPIENGLAAMKRLLELEGYYDHTYTLTWETNSRSKLVIANIHFESGAGLICESVELHFENETPLALQQQLQSCIKLVEGELFTEINFQKTQEALLIELMNQGYLWAKVEPIAQLSKVEQCVRVRYTLTTGPTTKIGPTIITGLTHLKEKLITREFEHHEHELFNYSNLLSTRKNLLTTRWFSAVTVTPDPNSKEGESIVPILLDLKEAEPRTFGIGLGLGSEVGPRASLSWQHRNWLGYGWKNKLDFEISSHEMQAKAMLDIPYAFRKDASAKINFSYQKNEEDDYNVLVGQLDAIWSRTYQKNLGFGVGWSLKSEEHDSDASLLNSLNSPPEAAMMTGPLLQTEWNAEKNHWGGQAYSAAWQGQTYFDANNSGAGFWKQSLHLHYRQNLPLDWKLVQRLKLGWMEALEGNDIPVSDRFYVGGSGSVRGYSRRSIGPRNSQGDLLGGKSMSEFSFELQHPFIVTNLIGAMFIDGGQLDLSPSGLQFSNYRYGIGTGIAYALPLGLIRIDVGFPLNRQIWDDAFQVHFDFGLSL